MEIVYRVIQDWNGFIEGWCVSEKVYKGVYYLDKPMFEPVTELERLELIKYDNKKYCIENNIECVLFYTEVELEKFKRKNIAK